MNWVAMLVGGMSIVGIVLLVIGWRGRRVGDHPHCRRCEFDLFGLRQDAASCPECGQPLLGAGVGPGATVRGAKQRRKSLLAAGWTLALMGGLLGGLAVWQNTSKASLYARAPALYLVWVASDKDARAELIRRLNSGELSVPTIERLVDRALDVQADAATPWDSTWGQIIEDAWIAGHVSDERIDRYARQAVLPSSLILSVRPKVQLGRKPTGQFALEPAPNRFGPTASVSVIVAMGSLRIDDRPVMLHQPLTTRAAKLDYYRGGGRGLSMSSLPLAAASQRLGMVPIEADVTMTVTVTIAGGPPPSSPIVLPSQRLAAEVQVVDEPTGDYVTDSALIAEIVLHAGVWIDLHGPGVRSLAFGLLLQRPRSPKLWFRPPMKHWLRVGDTIVPLELSSSSTSSADHVDFWVDRFDRTYSQELGTILDNATTVDLIIRPDIGHAETAVQQVPTWLTEWVFEDIPLNAEAISPPKFSSDMTELPTLVPARTRLLTLEEAEQPPRGTRD